MNDAPALFHSQTHINLWRSSPLRSVSPHVVLIVVVAVLSVVIFFCYQRWRKARQEAEELEKKQHEEQMLLRLVKRQQVVKNKIKCLEEEYRQGNVSEEEYKRYLKGYKGQLAKLKFKLESLEEDINV